MEYTIADVPISFELFPPNTPLGMQKLTTVWRDLNIWQPDYFSVTFGAGGTTQTKTAALVAELNHVNINVVPHLSCIGLTKAAIDNILGDYRERGIRALVVIRGDLPQELSQQSGDFQHASQLVEYIRTTTGNTFRIKVAAYPEFHPECHNVYTDLTCFKQKVMAGADEAITQYFFNKDAYFCFLESCAELDINIPIVPGIMPISDLSKLERFSKICGAEIPLWLYKRLSAYGDDVKAMRDYGIEIVSRLCDDLLQGGAPGLHFYTLNQISPTNEILEHLGLVKLDSINNDELSGVYSS